MKLTLIWAMAENRVIGRDGGLPWHLPDDLRHFKRATAGHAIFMGRRTWESVGKPLPGRTNIVISRQPDFAADGATVVTDLDAAIAAAPAGEDELFCVGGSEIYRLALPRADRLNVTVIHAAVSGDTYFPEFDYDGWELQTESHHGADEDHSFEFSFRLYERASR